MDNAVRLRTHTAPFDWRDLYLQALFETDRSSIRARIAEAKWALIRREHELFADPHGKAEREAVTNALMRFTLCRPASNSSLGQHSQFRAWYSGKKSWRILALGLLHFRVHDLSTTYWALFQRPTP